MTVFRALARLAVVALITAAMLWGFLILAALT